MTVPWARVPVVTRKHIMGIVAGLVVVLVVQLGRMETFEYLSLDRVLFAYRPSAAPTLPLVIVSIDESSVAELGQWPFPRAMHGELVRAISEGKPLAIGFDVIFDTPSLRGEEDDAVLGAAVAAAGNVVLGAALVDDVQPFYRRTTLNAPIPEIREGAAAYAPVNPLVDSDGHIRRMPLWLEMDGQGIPTFDAAMYRLVAKARPVAPLPAGNSLFINYRGAPRTFPWVSYYRVVRGEIPAEFWKDKVVLIGPTSPVMQDMFFTPFVNGREMPGVEIHANAIDTMAAGDYIREVPTPISTALALVGGILGCLLVVRLHAKHAMLTAVGMWIPLTVVAVVGFSVSHVWMRGMAGTTALALGIVLTVAEHYVRERRQRHALQRFFSPDVAAEVVRKGGVSTSRRLVTVLFSDIRGFTSLSEKLEPEQVGEMLREYLTEMTEVVFKHGGSVDKYIGDAIMALYNVPAEDPEHAVKAVRTALEFQERTVAVSKHWEDKLGIAIRNGVGVNTGVAVVGTLGSRQRFEYTAIGDTINLGARLESITKDYQTNIIISESTYELVRDEFITKELGEVTVKGKTRPVKIYTVLPRSVRRYARAALDAVATLSITEEGRRCNVTTMDISEGGMAVKGVPEDWRVGQVVEVRCDAGALPKPVVADAMIASRQGDEAGLLFTALDPDSARTIGEYVGSREGR
jgi:adenylate cyclase